MSNRSTKIQPVIVVDGGGVPVPPPGSIKAPSVVVNSQDLSVAAVDFTDAFAIAKMLGFLSMHFSAPLTGAQTLTITYDSADGAAFDTVILSELLPIGTTDKFFAFPPGISFRAGDHLRIQLTNTGTPAITASSSLNYDP